MTAYNILKLIEIFPRMPNLKEDVIITFGNQLYLINHYNVPRRVFVKMYSRDERVIVMVCLYFFLSNFLPAKIMERFPGAISTEWSTLIGRGLSRLGSHRS